MSIVGMLLVLVVVGVVLAFLPIDPKIRNIIIAVIALLAAVWLLEVFGVFTIGPALGPGWHPRR